MKKEGGYVRRAQNKAVVRESGRRHSHVRVFNTQVQEAPAVALLEAASCTCSYEMYVHEPQAFVLTSTLFSRSPRYCRGTVCPPSFSQLRDHKRSRWCGRTIAPYQFSLTAEHQVLDTRMWKRRHNHALWIACSAVS